MRGEPLAEVEMLLLGRGLLCVWLRMRRRRSLRESGKREGEEQGCEGCGAAGWRCVRHGRVLLLGLRGYGLSCAPEPGLSSLLSSANCIIWLMVCSLRSRVCSSWTVEEVSTGRL